jgi:hypothetical protein
VPIARMSTVLPDPLRPTNASRSPGRSASVTSSSNTTPPNPRRHSPTASTIGGTTVGFRRCGDIGGAHRSQCCRRPIATEVGTMYGSNRRLSPNGRPIVNESAPFCNLSQCDNQLVKTVGTMAATSVKSGCRCWRSVARGLTVSPGRVVHRNFAKSRFDWR